MKLQTAFFALICAGVAAASWACSSDATSSTPDGGSPIDSGVATSDTGTSSGTVADAGGGTTDLGTFTLECGTTTKDFAFTADKTEVIRFEATWRTANGDSVPGATILDSAGQTIDVTGNPLNLNPGLITTAETSSVVVHEFFTAGNHTLRFDNTPPGCNTITVSTKYTRVAPAVTNTTQATATALTKSTAVPGHIGCSTERWYKLTATSGEALSVVLTGERFAGVPADVVANFTLDLLDGAGQPVIVSGNPVSASGDIGNANSQIKLDHTVAEAGTFHVKLIENGCIAPVTYSIQY
ncbi:MAG: hypothetical protein U0270_01925 [Labilithrix sp.]